MVQVRNPRTGEIVDFDPNMGRNAIAAALLNQRYRGNPIPTPQPPGFNFDPANTGGPQQQDPISQNIASLPPFNPDLRVAPSLQPVPMPPRVDTPDPEQPVPLPRSPPDPGPIVNKNDQSPLDPVDRVPLPQSRPGDAPTGDDTIVPTPVQTIRIPGEQPNQPEQQQPFFDTGKLQDAPDMTRLSDFGPPPAADPLRTFVPNTGTPENDRTSFDPLTQEGQPRNIFSNPETVNPNDFTSTPGANQPRNLLFDPTPLGPTDTFSKKQFQDPFEGNFDDFTYNPHDTGTSEIRRIARRGF